MQLQRFNRRQELCDFHEKQNFKDCLVYKLGLNISKYFSQS